MNVLSITRDSYCMCCYCETPHRRSSSISSAELFSVYSPAAGNNAVAAIQQQQVPQQAPHRTSKVTYTSQQLHQPAQQTQQQSKHTFAAAATAAAHFLQEQACVRCIGALHD
jgi:hypothetical protein